MLENVKSSIEEPRTRKNDKREYKLSSLSVSAFPQRLWISEEIEESTYYYPMVNFSHSLYLLVARSLPFSRIPFSSFYPHFTFSSLRSQKIVRIKTFGGCKLKWDNRETGKATRSIRKFSRVSRFSHSRSENDTWFSGYIYIVRIISVSTHVCICSCMYAYTCYDR